MAEFAPSRYQKALSEEGSVTPVQEALGIRYSSTCRTTVASDG